MGLISEVGAIREVGECSHRNAINITDTPTLLTLTPNKTTIEIFNNGNKFVYIGGSGVTSNDGFPIFPKGSKAWNNVKPGWKVYLVCAIGESSEVRVIEYD